MPKLLDGFNWHGLLSIETKVSVLSKMDSMLFSRLYFADKNPIGVQALLQESKEHLLYKIIDRRLEAMKASEAATVPTKIFTSLISRSAGDAIMWAFTLNYMWVADQKQVDLSVLSHWFPFGFPTEEDRRTAWQAQKVPNAGVGKSDNLVDYAESWPKYPTKEEKNG